MKKKTAKSIQTLITII